MRAPAVARALELPQMRLAVARHDFAVVFHILQRHGLSQREISVMTGLNQSEISDVLRPRQRRQIQSYAVLVRLATGLGIPRGAMGLAYDRRTLKALRESTP